MKKVALVLSIIASLLSPGLAQLSQSNVDNDINNQLLSCGNGCNTAATLRSLLDTMVAATFQAQGANGLMLSGAPSSGWMPIATSPTTSVWGPPPGGVSILAFPGAAGDGTTDNSPAFAAALAELGSTGGTIYFPPGIFYASSTYKVPSNIKVQGAGSGATFLKGNDNCNPAPCNITLIIYGTLTGSNFTNVTTYAINVPTQSVASVTTTSPADANNFTAGMTVQVSGSLHGTSFWYPSWSTTVVSTNPSTGVIMLAEPLPLNGLTNYSSTVTITVAAPGVVTWAAHGLVAGTPVVFSNSGGSLPTGYTAGMTYFVAQDSNLTTNTFDVSPTYAQALAGTGQITTSGSPSGTQSATEVALTLIQQVVVQPSNIKVSDLTIIGTTDGSVQVQNANNVIFDHVSIVPGTGPGEVGSLSIAGSRNITVNQSYFLGGAYLECLGCFDSQFTGNMLPGGSIALDGGTQAMIVAGNTISNPTINGIVNPCFSIVSYSQFNRIMGNNCTNAGPMNFGIYVSGAAGEGGNLIVGNTISTTDITTSIAINLSNSNENVVTSNNINQANTGINLSNSTGNLLDANQQTDVTLPFTFDSTSSFTLPTNPVKLTIPTSGLTTVPVQGGYLQIFNSSPTSITNFTGGTVGQVLTVYLGNANTTFVEGSTLFLRGEASYNAPSNTIMQFILMSSGQWFELSRNQANNSAQEQFLRGINASGASNFTSGVFSSTATATSMIATTAAPIVTSGQIGYGSTTVAAGTATCPTGTVGGQTVAGCIVTNIAGTAHYVPYF